MRIKAHYVALADRMIERGPDLGAPHTKNIGHGLFEIRIKAAEGIARVFYCTQMRNEIVMLHAFVKKTQAIP
jgi:phage-related protein